MKKQIKRWLSIMTITLLAAVSLGAAPPDPLEEAENEALKAFRNNSILCDAGCGGYYMQQGQPVLAYGFDRSQGDAPTAVCSYPLVCVNCHRHIWYHAQVNLLPVEFQEGGTRCDIGCDAYRVQYGYPILARGFDRARENTPTVMCSYQLECPKCHRRTWHHAQVDAMPLEAVEKVMEMIRQDWGK